VTASVGDLRKGAAAAGAILTKRGGKPFFPRCMAGWSGLDYSRARKLVYALKHDSLKGLPAELHKLGRLKEWRLPSRGADLGDGLRFVEKKNKLEKEYAAASKELRKMPHVAAFLKDELRRLSFLAKSFEESRELAVVELVLVVDKPE
jgi:hypothetical protein